MYVGRYHKIHSRLVFAPPPHPVAVATTTRGPFYTVLTPCAQLDIYELYISI